MAVVVVMNGHGSFPGVGAFSVVGHNGVLSNIKILEKLDSGKLWQRQARWWSLTGACSLISKF